MSVVITGATGHLGRLVVEELLDRGHGADGIIAAGRDTDRLSALAERGVRTARIDFEDPASLKAAFEGADTVLLVSGSEIGGRVPQHRNAIEAATASGVGHLVYTSALRADASPLTVAPEHKATEEIIAASGIPHTILRNGWYSENYAAAVQQGPRTGSIIGGAGQGRISSAARADYAAAAAVVVASGEGHGQIHELAGDTAWTMEELAARVAEASGSPVAYRDLGEREHRQALTDAGLPEALVDMLVSTDQAASQGWLEEDSGALSRLIGRPTTPLEESVAAALSS
ncbi:SDR family oxidoreductase [Nocardiopsis sp. EMB25]|uniref:SDR family oxidoreductase n=1 Tax=Nocardiopsis sp. EMB25 TaxID=2835867 RepID=UPI002284C956|nr:SDR family oxidoreductase [Nocardiopsis sp. EMB25]MCY9783335.1 SDR family oxidoreductase [Nocardiopsis sp. EMB25]